MLEIPPDGIWENRQNIIAGEDTRVPRTTGVSRLSRTKKADRFSKGELLEKCVVSYGILTLLLRCSYIYALFTIRLSFVYPSYIVRARLGEI